MKNLIYVFLLLLVIGLSTSTAMAQCAAPYDTYLPGDGQSYYCIGDGAYMDAGYGITSNGVCPSSFTGTCGLCFDQSTSLSPQGLCLHAPCQLWMVPVWELYYVDAAEGWCNYDDFCSYTYATSAAACDPYDWSKLKLPAAPFSKDPEVIEARSLLRRDDGKNVSLVAAGKQQVGVSVLRQLHRSWKGSSAPAGLSALRHDLLAGGIPRYV